MAETVRWGPPSTGSHLSWVVLSARVSGHWDIGTVKNNNKKMKTIRIGRPGRQNLSWPRTSILPHLIPPDRPYGAKIRKKKGTKKDTKHICFPIISYNSYIFQYFINWGGLLTEGGVSVGLQSVASLPQVVNQQQYAHHTSPQSQGTVHAQLPPRAACPIPVKAAVFTFFVFFFSLVSSFFFSFSFFLFLVVVVVVFSYVLFCLSLFCPT